MKQAYSVSIRVFSKPEDNAESVKKTFLALFPFDLGEERIELKRQTATGFNERRIIIFEVTLKKDKHINKFLESLNKRLPHNQKRLLLKQIDSRLDSSLNFFLRLDKEELMNGCYKLCDHGNCYHIKIAVACFPRKRDVAAKVVEKIFKADNKI